jgi:dsRNA-specific ribonuclease
MSINGNPKKKPKLDENLYSFNISTHSSILAQPFQTHKRSFIVHLHKFQNCENFGVLLPVKFPKNSITSFDSTFNLSSDNLEELKSFQQELWTDLFKSTKKDLGTQSTANYLVVLLNLGKIDWASIKKATRKSQLLKFSELPESEKCKTILKTGYKSNATWKLVCELKKDSSSESFLSSLLGPKHPDLKNLQKKYKGYDPLDILFDESFKIQSIQGFRDLLTSSICRSFDESSLLLFAKQTKSIKHQPSPFPKPKENYHQNGTPLLISEISYVFYLKAHHWDQGRILLNNLIEIEALSFVVELSNKFNYQGELNILKEACQAPSLSPNCNYESLETLGDTVLKCVYTLHIYLNNLELNEFGLTRQRGWKVSNKCLSQIAAKHDLSRYLKTKSIKTNNFRPAYYISKDTPNESYKVEQKISESMLADFLEALIGAFYVGTGILAAGEFLLRLGIIQKDGWDLTSSYLTNQSLEILKKEDLDSFPEGSFPISKLLESCPRPTKISVFGYEFENVSIFKQALTHKTLNPGFNYERLEFLGDAIIDLIILTNIWTVHKFDPDYLTYFKHELVCNNTLAKISISTNLHKEIIVDKTIMDVIEKNWSHFIWDEDLYSEKDVVLEMPKCLGDIFESIVAGVLIDSNSLLMTCTVIGFVLGNIILYMVKNKFRYRKRIIARLCEKVSRLGKKIDFKASKKDGVFCVKVFVDNLFMYEDYGSSAKNAKDKACLEVFKRLFSQ